MVDVQSPQLRERLGGAIGSSTLDVHARCFRQQKHAEEDDETPCKLHSNRDAVGARIVATSSGMIDNGGNQEPDGDSELVSSLMKT